MFKRETIVMSVGGSLIVPDQIDTKFLQKLKRLVDTYTAAGRRFVIIAGGGRTARHYQEAAAAVSDLGPEDLDWMGIHATRLNGQLLRTIFRDSAYKIMITNPDDILTVPENEKVIIAAGYRPGASTDLRAVQIADHLGAHKLINLSDIDYVYTDDPKKNSQAEKIENISWPDFTRLIPEEWDPGLSSPFDPVAAREAARVGLEVVILSGTHETALADYLANKPFVGTRIS
ncbi:MAG: UMP kinase [Patescibacteria group bacterium]